MAYLSPELKNTYNLAVAGAGPMGLFTAITAARKGLSVCIVDYKEEKDIGRKVCGDFMGESVIGFIKDNLNLDYSDIITNKLKHMDIYSPDGTVISVPSDGVMIDRHTFSQKLLKDTLKEECDLKSACICKEPVIKDGCVCGVKIYDKNAEKSYVIHSDIVVDATGAAGILRKKACDNKFFDSPFIERYIDPEDMSRSYRQIIKLKNPLDNTDTGKMNLLSESGGYYWFFPVDADTANVGIGIARNHKEDNLKEMLEAIMAEDEIFNGSLMIEDGGGVVPTRRALYSLVDNGIMFGGDAAFQTNPLTGGGIGSSIGAGFMLATIAAEAIKNNDVSQEGLWGYNTWYYGSNNELRKKYRGDLFDGGIQAGRDIIRTFVQSLENKQVDWIFKNYMDRSTFSDMTSANSDLLTPKRKAKILIRGIRNPILLRIGETISLMKEMNEVYENYPSTSDLFSDWKKEVDSIDVKFNDMSTQSSLSLWLSLFKHMTDKHDIQKDV
ncbi:MAG: NAD(P)/FAD-dependent oxidoreductase [Candidatus Aenigmarchaeota archaeon]|nr:NAD(P)/FAD-dependent oxidoreductase [Candidatus Aenigmarchaeota archaeon]